MARERQIILDTETTGLYADRGDRMLEFAGIEMKKRQLTMNNLHLYIHPDRDIPEEAAAVHGITLEQLEERNAPKFEQVGRQIADFLRGAELIIHNARFDVGFLNMEFARMGLPSIEELDCEITDTLAMARELLAEVYLAMTREQFDLVGAEETAAAAQSADTGIAVQTAGGGLKILRADAEETAAHLEYLAELDKASGGQCLWTAEKTEQA